MHVTVGIDEAGYSPLLGPLVVSAAIFIHDDPIADWWRALGIPKARRGGLSDPLDRTCPPSPILPPVDDSKKIYTPSEGLETLETSVLAFLTVSRDNPTSLRGLLDCLDSSADPDEYPWYRRANVPLPVAADPERIQSCADALRESLWNARAEFRGFHAEPILEGDLNRRIALLRNKANVLLDATLDLVERSLMLTQPVQFLIDKQGGRDFYTDALSQFFFGSRVAPAVEGNNLSRYTMEFEGTRSDLSFCVRGDAAHLPIALASMLSKYVRELFMILLNRYWQAIDPAIPHTSGYRTDGWKFISAVEASHKKTLVPRHLLIRDR